VRFGVVILPEARWSAAAETWRRAEALGFDHAWTYDHLAWRMFRDRAWFAAVPTLTAAALVTQRIRLGVLVASPNFRHPVPFARELITLDDMARGRLTLGIGAGAVSFDASMLGHAPWSTGERTGRFVEFVTLLDRLLREPETTSAGRYYSADEARTYPGCVQRPRIPFALAATGPRGMRLAATVADTWVTIGDRRVEHPLDAVRGATLVAEQMAQLDDACASVGRDPATLRRLVLTGLCLANGLESPEAFRDTAGRYAAVGVSDLVVHWPRPEPPFAGDLGTFERIMASRKLPNTDEHRSRRPTSR